MTTYIVRPTAVITQVGTFKNQLGISSIANVLAAISDNSDSTYATSRDTGTTIRRWELLLAAPTIASGEYVARVGHVIRWKYNNSTKPIGVMTYRGIDPVPSGIPTLTPSSSVTTFTTNEIAYSPVAWSVAECADLRMSWYDGYNLSSTFAGTQHAEVWANVYTIARATATPQAATVTVSTPTVTVAVAHTIDWESSTLDWQNLRKIRVEMQVESGGTGIGTGTLIANVTQEFNATATGTSNRSISVGTPIANGSYKVYARAIRFREDGSTAADTTGSWSSAVTLTVNAPLPNTPTISAVADQVNDKTTVTVTPIATSGYTSPTILLERSDDGGSTWAAVRFAKNVAASFGVASVFTDYEAPRGQVVKYRARVSGTYSGAVNTSASTSPISITINADTWNLKCPTVPALNVADVRIVGTPSESPFEDQGVFRPLEREFPVVVSGTLGGWDGDLEIVCTTAAEWNALLPLLTGQKALLLESPFGYSKYVRLLSGTKSTITGTPTAPRRRITAQYVEVGQPAIVDGATS